MPKAITVPTGCHHKVPPSMSLLWWFRAIFKMRRHFIHKNQSWCLWGTGLYYFLGTISMHHSQGPNRIFSKKGPQGQTPSDLTFFLRLNRLGTFTHTQPSLIYILLHTFTLCRPFRVHTYFSSDSTANSRITENTTTQSEHTAGAQQVLVMFHLQKVFLTPVLLWGTGGEPESTPKIRSKSNTLSEREWHRVSKKKNHSKNKQYWPCGASMISLSSSSLLKANI